jgi:hypothetical protein
MGDPVIQRKAWDPAQDKPGLECRWCGCKHFRVIYTRPTWGGRILRRRECWHCGNKLNTVEQRL